MLPTTPFANVLSQLTPPPWLAAAFGYAGTHEAPGDVADNPVILRMAKRLGGWIASFYKHDSIPWCALFVNACLQEVGIVGTGTLAAGDFVKWGTALSTPAYGCILTFSRPGGNHVGFYCGERVDAFYVYGGNQSDAVGFTWIAKVRCTSKRWPSLVAPPAGGVVQLAGAGGAVSTNEA